jgi:hypothetical protein
LAGGIAQCSTLLSDSSFIEHFLRVEDCLFGWFQHRIHAPNNAHRQNHIWILATFEQVTKDIVGDTPNERYDFVVRRLIHFSMLFLVLDSNIFIRPALNPAA